MTRRPLVPFFEHGPLGFLATRINRSLLNGESIHRLREDMLDQTRRAAVQEERNRLARDLHDSIKQQLFAIQAGLAAAQQLGPADPEKTGEVVKAARDSAREALVEMNALLQQLSPAPLEKIGLLESLRVQCEALEYRTGAAVSAEFGTLPADDRLPPGAQDVLFRVAQEALNNIGRHSRARTVRLVLGQRAADAPVILEITDDGSGFDPTRGVSGMGLESMRARAELLGARLAVESKPGSGTTIRLAIPLTESNLEEVNMMPAKWNMNKAIVTGVLAGAVLIGLLYYPLMVLLLKAYPQVAANYPREAFFASIAVYAAGVSLAGFFSSRRIEASRSANTLLGATSGMVASAVFFFGLAGIALFIFSRYPRTSGFDVYPHPPLWYFNLDSLRADFETVRGVIWNWNIAFWVVLLCGTGLGALGSLAARASDRVEAESWIRAPVRLMVLALAVSSAFSLILNTMFYRPAEYILSQELPMFGIRFQEWPALLGGRSPSVSLLGISIWPIATPALLFLCSLGVLAVIDRFELRTGDAVRLASIPERSSRLAGFVFACFGLFGSIWLMPPLTASRWGVFIVFGVCCLIMGALYLYQMVAAERQARSAGIRLPAKTWLSFLFICVWTVPVPFALWRINARPGGIFPVLFWFLLGGLLLEGIHWYRWSRVDRFAATRIWGEDWQDFQTTLPGLAVAIFTGVMAAIAPIMVFVGDPVSALILRTVGLPSIVWFIYTDKSRAAILPLWQWETMVIVIVAILAGLGITSLFLLFRRRFEGFGRPY